MKIVKCLFKTLLVTVALVVLSLLTLPLWFGPVVKTVANVVAPKVVKTDFRLGHLSLNPYTARFELGDMQLWNPKGYPEQFAAKVGMVAVDAKTASLLTDVIHVEEITIKDVFASYVSGGENDVNNFKQIQYNVTGGKEKYEARQSEAAKLAEANLPVEKSADGNASSEPASSEPAGAEKPAKKIIIDKLTISGVKVQMGILPISVPFDITLTDIGKETGGATFTEVCQEVWASILKSAGAVGDQLKALGGLTGDAAGKTADAVGEGAKAVGESAQKALDKLKSMW